MRHASPFSLLQPLTFISWQRLYDAFCGTYLEIILKQITMQRTRSLFKFLPRHIFSFLETEERERIRESF